LFLPIINIDSASAKAHAEVEVVGGIGTCVICALNQHATGALTIDSAVTITGGSTWVNSDSATAIDAGGGSLPDTLRVAVLDGAASGACGMQGVFVFTGNINMGGNATLSTVNGAMIFLTCASFPTSYCGGSTAATGACPNAGAAGATFLQAGSSQTHYSPSPG